MIFLTVTFIIPLVIAAYYLLRKLNMLYRPKEYSIDFIKSLIPEEEFELKSFKVETKDGFILTTFRVRHKKKHNKHLNPVFMQHGFGNSAACWMVGGPHQSPALIIAGMGYDVYLGNCRCSVFSVDHATMKPWHPDYWVQSFQTMKYDIMANINEIYERVGERIIYAGISQGAITWIGAMADPERDVADEIADKLERTVLFAPVGYTVSLLIILVGLGGFFMSLYFFLKDFWSGLN